MVFHLVARWQRCESSDSGTKPSSRKLELNEKDFLCRFLAMAEQRVQEEKVLEEGASFHAARLWRTRRGTSHGWPQQNWYAPIICEPSSSLSSGTSRIRFRL
uniref:Uncharacterized protein n=1 Tax=Noctiluca scintillans TaxID=2966 RepID=A0A7S1F4B7_NOCSC